MDDCPAKPIKGNRLLARAERVALEFQDRDGEKNVSVNHITWASYFMSCLTSVSSEASK